jgi:hypothetical protein
MLSNCQIPLFLAYLMATYILASMYYMFESKSVGTPFSDAIEKYPELLKIKQQSSKTRSKIFYTGFIGSIVILVFLQPFKTCK